MEEVRLEVDLKRWKPFVSVNTGGEKWEFHTQETC